MPLEMTRYGGRLRRRYVAASTEADGDLEWATQRPIRRGVLRRQLAQLGWHTADLAVAFAWADEQWYARQGSLAVCHCSELAEVHDNDARTYADGHLEEVERRADGWEIIYRCPTTSARWLEDKPRSEEHGGGPSRLRRLDAEGQPIASAVGPRKTNQ